MSQAAIQALAAGELPKGDALATARVAGILAAKRTPEIVPLCHPIPLSYVGVDLAVDREKGEVKITATARAHAKTGAEMEALTAVVVAALTVHDMCKGLDPAAEIGEVHLVRKSGGKAGVWERGRARRSSCACAPNQRGEEAGGER
jgi:cyclic pyranopterin phosphate synthase